MKRNRILTASLFGTILLAGLGGLAASRDAVIRSASAESRLVPDPQRLIAARERERLSRNLELYDELSSTQQHRIMELHDELQAAPDRDELEQVMAEYTLWFDTLTPSQKDRLDTEDDPAKRVQLVLALRKEQQQELHRWLAPIDKGPIGSGQDLDFSPEKKFKRIRRWIEQASGDLRSRLNKLVSPTEREAFQTVPAESRLFYVLALGTKYNLSREERPSDQLGFMFDHFLYQPNAKLVNKFGPAYRPQNWDEATRAVVGEAGVLTFLLPPLDEATLNEMIDEQDPLRRDRLRQLQRLDDYVFRQVMAFQYYYEHPSKLPQPLAQQMEKIENYQYRHRPGDGGKGPGFGPRDGRPDFRGPGGPGGSGGPGGAPGIFRQRMEEVLKRNDRGDRPDRSHRQEKDKAEAARGRSPQGDSNQKPSPDASSDKPAQGKGDMPVTPTAP